MKDNVSSIVVGFGNAKFTIYNMILSERKNPLICHNHRYYELHFALRGKYNYKIAGKTVTLERGGFLIIPPDVLHDAVMVENDEYEYVVFEFGLEKTDDTPDIWVWFYTSLEENAGIPLRISSAFTQRLMNFKALEPLRDVRSYCEMKAEAGRLVYELFNNMGSFDFKRGDYDAEPSTETMILLDSLINQGFSIREIAGKINYSERHTARLIKSVYADTLTGIRKRRESGDK